MAIQTANGIKIGYFDIKTLGQDNMGAVQEVGNVYEKHLSLLSKREPRFLMKATKLLKPIARLIRDVARPSDQLAWRGGRGCGTRAKRQRPEAARQRQT